MQSPNMENMHFVMRERKSIFDKTIDLAEECINKKRYELGARYIQIASCYVSNSHAGFFYSDKAEKLLVEICAKKMQNTGNIMNNNYYHDSIKKVLHVATEIYDIGGHTRVIQNWIEYDSQRINDLVITDQVKKDIPKELLNSFEKKGINVYFLKTEHEKILTRAQILRNLSREYDVVILHIHPYDVIPVIALNNNKIPVLFMNHADHIFWIGRSVSDKILEIRKHGKILSNQRRGINSLNQAILPIPLKPLICVSREEAREDLKIGKDELIIFSVASSFKYIPNQEGGIEQILLPLTSKFSNLRVIIAGPNPQEKYWIDIFKQSKGRIEAIGIRSEVDHYYIASDLYLDSYPISSLTSLLDAAKYGLPIISMEKGIVGLDLDDIALDNIDYKLKSLEEIIERISNLIENPYQRKQFGEICARETNKCHTGNGWVSFLEDVYNNLSVSKKENNMDVFSAITEQYDYPLVYAHNKNRSLIYEFLLALNNNFDKLPFTPKIKYFPLLFISFIKEPLMTLKVITPPIIKSLLKKGIKNKIIIWPR